MTSIGIGCQGGKSNASYVIDGASTLAAISHGTPRAVAFIIDPLGSNSMKSKNPFSGFHREDVAGCLDTTNPNPNKGQGGMVIVTISERDT